MDTPPGLIHWHAPLTVLSPGILLVAAALAIRLPKNRRALLAVPMATIALALAVLVMRAMWVSGGHWATLPGGWVHSGTIAAAAAIAAAVAATWRRPLDHRWALDAGTAYLMAAWCLPIAALVPAWYQPARRSLLTAVAVSGMALAWWTVPALGQCLTLAAVTGLAPAWRIPASIGLILAVVSLLVPETVP